MKNAKLISILFLVSSCAHTDYIRPDVSTTFDDKSIEVEETSEDKISLAEKEKNTKIKEEDEEKQKEKDEQELKTPYLQVFCSLYENWWEFFQDEKLNEIINIALINNKDIIKYIAKFEEAIALAGVAKSNLAPDLNLVVGASNNKNSNSTSALGTTGLAAGLMLSWEVDIWGQLAEASNAAQASVKASKLLLDTMALSVSNAIANTYFQIIAIKEKHKHLTELRTMLVESYSFEERKYKSGLVNNSTLNEISNDLLDVEVQIPQLEQSFYDTKLALTLLVGRIENIKLENFDYLNDIKLESIFLPELPKEMDSRFLLNRPDIISAEQSIIAANHNINSARDMYFPKFVITAGGGYNLSSGATDGGFYNLNLYLLQPIFNRKAIASQIAKNEALHKFAIANYEATIGQAVKEGITVLLDLSNFDKQYESSQKMTSQLETNYKNEEKSFNSGHISKYDLVKSAVIYKKSVMNLLDAKYKQITARTNFYKVFAGEYKYGNI